MHELNRKSALELLQLIESRQISPVDVVAASIARQEEVEGFINAFVCKTPELALAAAVRSENALFHGERTPLNGIPVSVKDLIDVAGLQTTFGSRTMVGNCAAADAPSVEKIKAAGASIVGKTTTTEFGCKAGGGDSPLTGITRNPWDLSKSTGGSSAGAAASVAAGVTPLAIGTDGGGSLRIPASLCGLVGVKAHFGRVPVYPSSATPTLAHVGAIARTVRDAALLLGVMSGYDCRDPATILDHEVNFGSACDLGVVGLKVAWSPTLGYARPSTEVLDVTEKAVKRLEYEGISVDLLDSVFPEDPIDLWEAEFYAGVGYKLKKHLKEAAGLLDPAVAEMLNRGLHSQTVEQYMGKVFARIDLRERFRRTMEPYDILLTPTLPVSELQAGANLPRGYDDRSIISWAYYTYPFNLTGNPALSIPCGKSSTGMPVGLQMVAKAHREVDIFRLAARIEELQPWSLLAPL